MKRVHCLLAIVLLLGLAFSQFACNSGGIFGGGGGAGIEVGAATPGTKVYIDNKYIGTVIGGQPGPAAYVTPGMHTLKAVVAGREPFEMSVYGFAGQTKSYDLPLEDEMPRVQPKSK